MSEAEVLGRGTMTTSGLAPHVDPGSVSAAGSTSRLPPFLSLHHHPTTAAFAANSSTSVSLSKRETVAHLQRPTRSWPSCHHRSPAPVPLPADGLSTLMDNRGPPSAQSIRSLIGHAAPSTTVQRIDELPSPGLQRLHIIKVSEGRSLTLVLPPLPMVRLLRSERSLVLSETLLVPWLHHAMLEDNEVLSGSLVEVRKIVKHEKQSTPATSSSRGREARNTGYANDIADLLHFLPALIEYSSQSTALGFPFALFEATTGTTIDRLTEPLAPSERQSVDFQKGRLVRRLSNWTAPIGRFGPAAAVLSQPTSLSKTGTASSTVTSASGCSSTWTMAFHSLLEGVLRDGEDMAITIGYTIIRGHFQRLGHILDAVTIPRLVMLDGGNDSNVLVTRSTKQSTPMSVLQEQGGSKVGEVGSALGRTNIDGSGKKESESSNTERREIAKLAVTGLLDWSNCIFGDPLMATVFNDHPSTDFLRGFGCNFDETTTKEPVIKQEKSAISITPADAENIIEDRENAHIRLLLYECFHATVFLVTQFYRPGADSGSCEMAARKRLSTVLRKLDDIDDAAGKRLRRHSSDPWPSKKSRPGSTAS